MVLLAKDHKASLTGRPLVAAVDTPSNRLAKMLAECLKPMLSSIPAHLKDTMSFVAGITHMHFEAKSPVHFGSFDVVNLYGSIPLAGDHSVFLGS